MVNGTNEQFIGLKDKLFELNRQEFLSRLPLYDIGKFLGEYGIQSPKGRLLIVDPTNTRDIMAMLQDEGIDIGDDTLHNDGAFIRELGIIIVRWKDSRYDINDEIALARMAKTIVHESVHSDGYAFGLSEGQDVLGYVDLTQNSGWYLEEGICEYLARKYLLSRLPATWFSHMNEILSRPQVSPRYIMVPDGRISSATDIVNLNPKNEHAYSLETRAIYLTPDRINDPYASDSSLAALGIDTLINNDDVPLNLFIGARKNPLNYQALQDAINKVDPNLFGKLLRTKKDRTSFWSTTLNLQKTAL
ncbi:hypothetical protein HY612_00210 [Candidatus Roizmanbacteria bacterium]|nr:hypothetical protein [Candidatus Roizmanbacteria bacterium]